MPALQHGPSSHTDRQVLVVGTGLPGLATAVACRERGFDPVVVAGADPDRHRVLTLWRQGITLLEGMGLADALSPGVPVRRWVCRHGCGTPDERFVHDGAPETAPCIRVRRARVEGALAEALPGDRFRPARSVRRVERGRSGPVVTLDDGVRERFDVVVGADGAGSRVRAAALDSATDGGAETGVSTRPSGSSHGPPRLAARDTVYEHRSAEGAVTRLGPLEGGDVWRYVGPRGGDHRSGVERWVAPGVALVGQAAHPLPQTVTTRDSLAVEDGTTLAAVLASRPATRAALQTYERRRRHRVGRLYGDYRPESTAMGDSLRECRSAFLRATFGGGGRGDA